MFTSISEWLFFVFFVSVGLIDPGVAHSVSLLSKPLYQEHINEKSIYAK